jgi:prevent-host-death family protein
VQRASNATKPGQTRLGRRPRPVTGDLRELPDQHLLCRLSPTSPRRIVVQSRRPPKVVIVQSEPELHAHPAPDLTRMTASVTVYEAKTHLSQLLDRAAAGEEIVIARAGRPVARLVALSGASSRRRTPGVWRGRVSIADDFDELPADMEAAFRGERP